MFSQGFPYLVSVESGGEEGARGFQQDTRLTFEEIAEKLNAAPGHEAHAPGGGADADGGGLYGFRRVAAMLVGGRRVEGAAFRQALGLRSTWFTLSMDEQAVTFHQQGYGHGVGMSQAGANSMAADGADYRSILMHYYPGVAIEKR